MFYKLVRHSIVYNFAFTKSQFYQFFWYGGSGQELHVRYFKFVNIVVLNILFKFGLLFKFLSLIFPETCAKNPWAPNFYHFFDSDMGTTSSMRKQYCRPRNSLSKCTLAKFYFEKRIFAENTFGMHFDHVLTFTSPSRWLILTKITVNHLYISRLSFREQCSSKSMMIFLSQTDVTISTCFLLLTIIVIYVVFFILRNVTRFVEKP